MITSNVHNQNQAVSPLLQKDETIHYRGHGKLDSSPASTSVLHVISHELDHVAEYKAEAVRKGADIRDINVKIRYEIRDGKMVAVGGETRVTTETKPAPEKSTYEDLYVDSLFPTIQEINARKDSQASEKKTELPLDEQILKEKLEAIQYELKSVLTRAIFRDPEHRSIDDIRNDRKENSYIAMRNYYEGQLDELKRKEQEAYSRALATKLVEMQKINRTAFIDLGSLTTTSARLDLIA